jgi:diguanylate cyclase (GGDEF)-like protein
LSGQITDYLEKIIKTSKDTQTGDPEWGKAKKIAIDLAILNRRSDKENSDLDPVPPLTTDKLDDRLASLIKVKTKQSVVVVSIYATFLSVALSVAALSFFSIFQGAALFELGLLQSIVMPLIIVPPLAYFVFTQIYLLNKATLEKNTLSRTDSLTGLYNKSFFSELVEMELAVASRYSFPSSLFLVDLDHFQSVNDNYGFKVGDQVLRVVATSVRDNLRGSDLVGRFDGEKIVAYLPHTTCEQALIAAERVRGMISDMANRFDQAEIDLTASIGVSATEFGFDTFDRLIQGAHSAVHEAKSGGCNRVEYITVTQVEQELPADSTPE